ncbi:MAG: DUF2807 domain-containing protein [Polaribacter sp.]|nr:DUF2807 domain-containing protein [Polaribacter sp.]
MKKIILTSILLTIVFSINAQSWWGGKRVRGNGNVVTETRNTANYDAISVGGSFDVVLVKGKEGDIRIKGEENLIEHIITEVSGDKLKIRFKRNVNIRTTRKLVVTVPYKDLEKISLGGSGNIRSSETLKADRFSMNVAGSGSIHLNLAADTVKSSVTGSGNINVSGNATNLTCSITGSGNINAYGLKVVATSVKVTGSGNIKTTANQSIDAKVVGSGNIYYKGKATHIKSKSIGSGDVIDRN